MTYIVCVIFVPFHRAWWCPFLRIFGCISLLGVSSKQGNTRTQFERPLTSSRTTCHDLLGNLGFGTNHRGFGWFGKRWHKTWPDAIGRFKELSLRDGGFAS